VQVPVIIPVENQVREFDPKLLLACVAARRGFPAIIGSRREIDFHIARLPRGFYLSKSLTARSVRMFGILRRLGHQVLAWDEEALVHLPPETYYSRRLSPKAIEHVSHLIAWGEDNAELFAQYPHLHGVPIHATGNPRNDFLRPELRGFFEDRARAYRAEYGDFILVNTNFNHVNSFYPGQNIFVPQSSPSEPPRFGRGGTGMTVDYASGLRDHKQALFEHFQRLIPELEKRLPGLNVVVRPHPTENHEAYKAIAGRCRRVRVINEGNVVAWLLAARALVHNGCTTGVEAYCLGVPAVSFRPRVDERYDDGFYRLPNRASHQAFDVDELVAALEKIVAGTLGAAGGPERKAVVDHYLAAQDGPLAVERIVELLEQIVAGRSELDSPPLTKRLQATLHATLRRWNKKRKGRKPGSQSTMEFHRHRFPTISLNDVESRLAGLQLVLHDTTALEVDEIGTEIFRIRRRDTSASNG